MTRCLLVIAMALPALCGVATAQTGPKTKQPIAVGSQYLASIGAKVKFMDINKMSASASNAVRTQQAGIVSLPTFSGSFVTRGFTYAYTMVGGAPQKGGSTTVPTSMIPISLFFDEFVDRAGNNITIDVTPDIRKVLNSPDFSPALYEDGVAQHADAVQRAEFFKVMGSEWHTRLDLPRMLTPVQIEVPIGSAMLFQTSDGTLLTLMDINFFISQLNTIIQLEGLKETELPIALTANVLLYDNFDPNQCCILGFHTAFETKSVGNTHFLQTFAWASWLDPQIFSDPTVADILPLSHEITETLNNPFLTNAAPSWQFPDGSGNCQGDLEVADPVEVLSNPGFPVLLNGFVYHPQNMALLQWFSRETPSSAFKGAYSFPNRTLLTSPSVPCAK